ncbi:MAG: hypothetical protein J6D53_08350 [Blautia sp.]|nr:hypothetical protein [Blautia sp.]
MDHRLFLREKPGFGKAFFVGQKWSKNEHNIELAEKYKRPSNPYFTWVWGSLGIPADIKNAGDGT